MTQLPQIRKIFWHLQLLKSKLTLQFSLVLYLIIIIIPCPLRAAVQGQAADSPTDTVADCYMLNLN